MWCPPACLSRRLLRKSNWQRVREDRAGSTAPVPRHLQPSPAGRCTTSSLSAPIQFSSMYPDPRTVHAHLQGDPPAHVKAYHINRAYGPMLRQAWPYGTVDDCGMSTVHAITRRRTCHAAHRHDYCSSQMAAQVLHSRRGPPACVSWRGQ
jgi:hypothetical protein